MYNFVNVHVCYSGSVQHVISEMHARPIRREERENLKKEFKCGLKPLTKYLDFFSGDDCAKILSGNADTLGRKDTHVFRQISTASRQNRFDEDLLSSLIKMKFKMCEDKQTFIQKISADPLYVLFWSEEGLKIYHKLGTKYPLFWDATGSVVRRNRDGKQMLYYEMAIKNPVNGEMGIPVTSMITADNSMPTVMDWMTQFRHAEKKSFGYNSCIQPMLIISDQSWVFILTALNVFNSESLAEFLIRMWDEEHTKKRSLTKTKVHLCASHFMNKVKKFSLKHYKRHASFGLYSISLLMNCTSLIKAGQLLKEIFICFFTFHISSK